MHKSSSLRNTTVHDGARQARRARALGLSMALLSAGALALSVPGPWNPLPPAAVLPRWLTVMLMLLAACGPLGLALLSVQFVRRQAERDAAAAQQLQERRRRLMALLDALPLAVALVDPQEDRALPNQALLELLLLDAGGASRPSLDWLQWLAPEDAAAWAAARDAVLAGGSARWLRCSLRIGGTPRPALMQLLPWPGEDGPALAVQLALADGDSGRAQEAQLQLRELLVMTEGEKWQFGQAVHDELGQRLSGIAYFAKALQRRLQQAARVEADDAGWLTNLANESMSAARDLARGLLPVGTDDPRELSTALAELCERSGKTFGIDIALSVDPAFDAGGAARASHLYRAIQELVTNAVKHGAARQVQVRLEMLEQGQRVTVRNDGRSLAAAPFRAGMGLRGVRSRAAYLDAQFSLLDEGPGAVLATIELPRAGGPSAQNGGSP